MLCRSCMHKMLASFVSYRLNHRLTRKKHFPSNSVDFGHQKTLYRFLYSVQCCTQFGIIKVAFLELVRIDRLMWSTLQSSQIIVYNRKLEPFRIGQATGFVQDYNFSPALFAESHRCFCHDNHHVHRCFYSTK